MAALHNAVSPDFTYSQSYLSLLSASGCMTGIICCASPSLWAMMKRVNKGRQVQWRHRIKALRVYVSRPTGRGIRGTRATWGTWTQPVQEESKHDDDIEERSESSTGAETVERRLSWQVVHPSERLGVPSDNDVNDGAVALFDFQCRRDNELPLEQGQLVWVHQSLGQGWLLVEHSRTSKLGLVPEEFVRPIGPTIQTSVKQIHSSSLEFESLP